MNNIYSNQEFVFPGNRNLAGGYPRLSPYTESNIAKFGVGPAKIPMPQKNQIEISQKIFTSSLYCNNEEIPSTMEETYENQNKFQNYLMFQKNQQNEDVCFCCLGSIKESQREIIDEQIEQFAQMQVEKGQQLLTTHQQFLYRLAKKQKERQRYQQIAEQQSQNKVKQQQSSLSKYFKMNNRECDSRIEQQRADNDSGFKCSQCFRRVCSQCYRSCQECGSLFCRFDYEDESVMFKHHCFS